MFTMKKIPLFLLLLLIASCTAGQTTNPDIHNKIDSIFREYDSLKPGVAIAVIKDGKLTFKKGYGLANLEYNIPITPETKFHVASVSKQFTAFSIYLLKKAGKLELEDDVRKYIPELPKYSNGIKIKHLLAHTSGIRDQWALLTLAGWQMEDVITTEQILKLINAQKELNFESGSQYGYSNSGYTLLAEIVSRVSGKSFSDFTRENIFIPLGMTNTLFNNDFHNVIKNNAHSYELVRGQYEERKLNYSTTGATSLVTTIEDLAKWILNFENPVVGDHALIKEYNQISTYDNGKPVVWSARPNDTTYHAKGQLHWQYNGHNAISHGGHDAGFRAVLTRFVDSRLAIVTLSNNEHFQMLGKVLPIADLYLAKPLSSESTVSAPIVPQQQKNNTFNNRLTDYTGKYYSDELYTTYEIKLINDKLVLTHPRLSDIILTATGEGKFSGRNSFPFELSFNQQSNKVIGFTISNFGVKNLKFLRIN